jgi:nickel/cobalt transporter (NiCoT) family protein
MHSLSTSWHALCALAFLFGMRHGMDADHLAAIDALTRLSSRAGHAYSRYCGLLFSMGHGAVVLLIALLLSVFGKSWAPPSWLEDAGGLISIAFLALLGVLNLQSALRAPFDAVVSTVGLRGRFVSVLMGRAGRWQGAGSAAFIGALFALSFDTLSQSALFAAMGVRFGGAERALVLGLLFNVGMLTSDGVNGWWVSRLADRTDRMALVASRAMTMTVGAVSLLVAALGVARMASNGIDGWLAGKELGVGLIVILLVAASYLFACGMVRSDRT